MTDLTLTQDEVTFTVTEGAGVLDATQEVIELTATVDTVVLDVTEDTASLDVTEAQVVLEAEGAVVYLEEDAVPYDKEIDEPVAGTLYVGEASPGTATSEAKWRIKRVTSNPTGLSTDWAGGTAAFDKVWDDRTSLSYGP